MTAPLKVSLEKKNHISEQSDIVIEVKNVGKQFHLYQKPLDRLRHTLFWRIGKTYGQPFWALRDVSFQIKKGETFGIIGQNGSGKSTLLQILAGILGQTTGEVEIQGRVAALLELGSGFNPEFTGRVNAMVNGMIMGIPQEEMTERFDQIADFADIGEFIDLPVKFYSSGMFVRLAFAVAAGVDADILLIDEALAVGDLFFRQKCYKRLENLRNKGVSILFVSHAMNEVQQFCERGMILDKGQNVYLGTAVEAVKRYYLLKQLSASSKKFLSQSAEFELKEFSGLEREDAFDWPSADAFLDISGITQISNKLAKCTGIALCNSDGQPCMVFQQGQKAKFFYEFEILEEIEVPIGGIEIINDKGIIVHGKNSLLHGTDGPVRVLKGQRIRFCQEIGLEIAPGEYTFNLGLATIDGGDYRHRSEFSNKELSARMHTLNVLTDVGVFSVIHRINGKPVQLLHFGLANLPGQFRIKLVPNIPNEKSQSR